MAHHMPKDVERELRALPGNDRCVDCGAAAPAWASPTLGVFMCLECSGRHRSLGVHLSFVRSVSMDSWKEHEILAMRVGGNCALIDHFAKYGVDNSMPIKKKYNTAAAEMYREILVAKKNGTPIPTDIQPYIDQLAKEAAAMEAKKEMSGQGSSNSAFRNQGMGSHPLPTPQEQNDPFNFDFSDSTRKVSAFADSALKSISASSRQFQSKVASANIGESVSGAFSSIKATATDPALVENVSKTASSFWGMTKGFFNTATTFVTSAVIPPENQNHNSSGGAATQPIHSNVQPQRVSEEDAYAREANTARMQAQVNRNAFERSELERQRNDPPPATEEYTGEVDGEDAEWLAAQVSKIQTTSSFSPNSKYSSNNASNNDEWSWEDESTNVATTTESTPSAVSTSHASTAKVSPAHQEDDFFASFGVKS